MSKQDTQLKIFCYPFLVEISPSRGNIEFKYHSHDVVLKIQELGIQDAVHRFYESITKKITPQINGAAINHDLMRIIEKMMNLELLNYQEVCPELLPIMQSMPPVRQIP